MSHPSDGRVQFKLADFGAATFRSEREGCISKDFRTPENKASAKADVWCLGATIYNFISDKMPSRKRTPKGVSGSPSARLSELVIQCLRIKPDKRVDSKTLLKGIHASRSSRDLDSTASESDRSVYSVGERLPDPGVSHSGGQGKTQRTTQVVEIEPRFADFPYYSHSATDSDSSDSDKSAYNGTKRYTDTPVKRGSYDNRTERTLR